MDDFFADRVWEFMQSDPSTSHQIFEALRGYVKEGWSGSELCARVDRLRSQSAEKLIMADAENAGMLGKDLETEGVAI